MSINTSSSGSTKVGTKTYTTRTDLNDTTVKIECENDKIKVTTDDDVAYAVPAKQNIDIILAVPTNSAALNQYNRDKNTVTAGTPYISTSTTPTDDAKSTPIYQITRAYQEFLKNFFYTRGVNVGVIPYSGNISLRNDTIRSYWVQSPNNFVSTNFLNGTSQPGIMGAMTYNANGTADTNLTTGGNYGGGSIAYGLLCRGNTLSYKGNTLTYGDLLSVANPWSYKFRGMIYNPCYPTNANLLSMRCEKTSDYRWMNPYFILEMNPDVKFIYGMLGAFYPYYDDRNVSNFIFIPVTWANNLLQSWSATGANSKVDTDTTKTPSEMTDAQSGRLSTPSKTTAGRKKALILVVNKPDWFEPGELTYIGFDNDYSETPAVESDVIRFDVDHSNTSKKYADGTAYNGTIQGQKKILKYTTRSGTVTYTDGNYQCTSSATGRLSFPQKWLLKVVVAPTSGSGTISFSNITTDSSATTTGNQEVTGRKEFFIVPSQMNGNYIDFTMTNIKLISAELTNRPYEMKDGVAEFKGLDLPENGIYIDLLKQGLNGKLKYNLGGTETDETNNALRYGADASGNLTNTGIKHMKKEDLPGPGSGVAVEPEPEQETLPPTDWETKEFPMVKKGGNWYSVCYGGGKFVAVAYNSQYGAYSTDGTNWTEMDMKTSREWYSVCSGKEIFIAIARYSQYGAWSTDGINWTEIDMGANNPNNGIKSLKTEGRKG